MSEYFYFSASSSYIGKMKLIMDRDRILAGLVRLGSQKAFAEIMRSYSGMVYRLAMRMLGDSYLADDITQEVFLKLWTDIGRYSSEYRLSTWIYRIAYNLCIDRIRARNDSVPLDGCRVLAPTSSEADYSLGRDDCRKIIDSALAGLSPLQRAVFVLKEVDGLDYSEIEKITGVGYDSLKSSFSLARKKIRSWITDK